MLYKNITILSMYLLMTSVTNAQFGGGGFGGAGERFELGQGGFGPNGPGFIESQEILIAISNSGKSVTAFSSHTGKTASLSFEKKIEKFTPIVSNFVACFNVDETAYAFSSETGKWDSVKTSDKLFFPISSSSMITISNGNKLYAFGKKHGKWITTETEGQLVPQISDDTVKATDGGKIYICSENSKEWQVIDLESDE